MNSDTIRIFALLRCMVMKTLTFFAMLYILEYHPDDYLLNSYGRYYQV